MRMYGFLTAIMVFFLICSCSTDEDTRERHVMNDGTEFYTDPVITYYSDKASFRNGVLKARKHYAGKSDEIEWFKDSLYGYSGDVKTLEWKKAKFGNWIGSYGLNPGKVYYVAFIEYSKFIPATYEDWIVEGEYFSHDEDSIGVDAFTGEVGYELDPNMNRGYYEATTLIKCISYDDAGESVGVYFPVKPEGLKWKFLKSKYVWK